MQVLRRSALLALVALAAVAAPAPAAPGPTVTIRIEGENATLLPRTQVTTSTDPVPGGDHCPGTSVAGAIEVATGGNWDRLAFTSTILGETHSFANSDYWAEWLNGKYGGGVCSDMLAPGDDVVMLVDFSPPPSYAPTVFPVTLQNVPASVERGGPFAVRVVENVTDGTPGTGTPTPVAGATVSGGGAAGTTGPDGTATLSMPSTGTFALRAVKSSRARSETESVCVHDSGDGACGTVAIAPHRVLRSAITGPRAGQVFGAGRGPRLLRGTIDPGTDGLDRVRLRLRRTRAGRCTFYSVRTERWLARRCGAAGLAYTISARPTWSYLLPTRLGRGRYQLTVYAIDSGFNAVPAMIDFRVVGST